MYKSVNLRLFNENELRLFIKSIGILKIFLVLKAYS
jgi:hypothetical protein